MQSTNHLLPVGDSRDPVYQLELKLALKVHQLPQRGLDEYNPGDSIIQRHQQQPHEPVLQLVIGLAKLRGQNAPADVNLLVRPGGPHEAGDIRDVEPELRVQSGGD